MQKKEEHKLELEEKNLAVKQYNMQQLQNWRDNIQAAKQEKVNQEYAAKVHAKKLAEYKARQ